MSEQTTTKKRTYINKTLPAGKANWCHVLKPDSYKGKKFYKATVSIPTEDCASLIAELQEIIDNAYEEFEAEATGKDKAMFKKGEVGKYLPFEAEYDDNGDETGRIVFKAKCNVSKPPTIVDAKKQRVYDNVYRGDTIRLAVSFSPYPPTPLFKNVGLSCFLNAVQILEKSGYAGGDDTSGFDVVEDGYVGNTDGSAFDDDSADDDNGDFQ